ncbi:hypothetical protein AOQ84DRAFT_141996 [Glonium stellatum]|uniref:Secreted protein n=1 Tax=Glonium stellatum TaxID=574774 RepID=A0A8E2ERT7_9PEZI|nr:hypothetical protein AOQ84DRAFT_141996 [Glonium stellatum]
MLWIITGDCLPPSLLLVFRVTATQMRMEESLMHQPMGKRRSLGAPKFDGPTLTGQQVRRLAGWQVDKPTRISRYNALC